MKKEVEHQMRIKNPVKIERKLRKIGKYLDTKKQIDKYFVLPNRDFFAKDPPIEYLRIRFEKEKNHLLYSFLHFDKKDRYQLISTDEYEIKIEDPKMLETIFSKIGLIQKTTVKKIRKYFDCGNFLVTLDKVNGLGNFIEVEAKKIIKNSKHTLKLIDNFLKDLNINRQPYGKKVGGYPRMLYLKKYNKF